MIKTKDKLSKKSRFINIGGQKIKIGGQYQTTKGLSSNKAIEKLRDFAKKSNIRLINNG